MSQKHIRLKNQLEEIETLVCAIEEFGEIHALPARVMFDMNLVLEEIITNTISYGYEDEQAHYIIVDIDWENQMIKLTVSDDGRPFNPLEMAVIAYCLLQTRFFGNLLAKKTDCSATISSWFGVYLIFRIWND